MFNFFEKVKQQFKSALEMTGNQDGFYGKVKALSTALISADFLSAFVIDAFAESNDAWSQVVGFFQTWIPRIGGAAIILGLVFFGLGWLRDDADSKMRGIQIAIGGAIVAAVGGMVGTFMNASAT